MSHLFRDETIFNIAVDQGRAVGLTDFVGSAVRDVQLITNPCEPFVERNPTKPFPLPFKQVFTVRINGNNLRKRFLRGAWNNQVPVSSVRFGIILYCDRPFVRFFVTVFVFAPLNPDEMCMDG